MLDDPDVFPKIPMPFEKLPEEKLNKEVGFPYSMVLVEAYHKSLITGFTFESESVVVGFADYF